MSHRTKTRILMLDDDPFVLKLLGHTLTALGFTQVTACTEGTAALACLDSPSCTPELILFDLSMPGMDGAEFVRHLVDRGYAGSLLLVSGENERTQNTVESLVRSHGIHIIGRLEKPVERQALALLIEAWEDPRRRLPVKSKRVYSAQEVRAAINGGQFVNHYQPKVAVTGGQVRGVEALVRWRHPVDGMVFPDQFIGVAETHGLIGDLTASVLREALADARRWRDAGLVMRVSVNVSMNDLLALDFPQFVAEQAALAGVPTEDVILEVTESRWMQDESTALEVLTRLRLKRFSLSIDDFGTGHSSLARLRDCPFDELKVDRGFVHGAHADETLRAIYEASLRLAMELRMDIVAEGVEDQHDWELLRRTGCSMAQGWFIAMAMPAAEVPDWIEAWEARFDERFETVARRASSALSLPHELPPGQGPRTSEGTR